MSGRRYKLKTLEDRKRAFQELREIIVSDLVRGRIPTFHILHVEYGMTCNHYMTPISLEPVDEKGSKAIWIQDFEFFLKLMLRLKRVKEVEYDPKRPALVFLYAEH